MFTRPAAVVDVADLVFRTCSKGLRPFQKKEPP